MRGFYHQRSGTAPEKPYTDFVRPRPYHPDDGVVIYYTNASLMETGNGLNLNRDGNNFTSIRRLATTDIVPNSFWGGYFDAADWD